MQRIPIAEEKNLPLFAVHYGLITVLHLYLAVFALIFTHPVYLAALLAALVFIFAASDSLAVGKTCLRLSFPLILTILLMNILFSRAGTTVLAELSGGEGRWLLTFTWEALAYGAVMALRLMVIIGSCASFFTLVSPDKMMLLMGKFGHKWALTLNLTLRLVPLMIEDYSRIAEVQRCRGVGLSSGGIGARLRSILPTSSILLLSSLERSAELAESMYARGFGSGPRSSYQKAVWNNTSSRLTAGLLAAVVISIIATICGWSHLNYYPTLAGIDWLLTVPAALIAGALVWGCGAKGGGGNVSDGNTSTHLYISDSISSNPDKC